MDIFRITACFPQSMLFPKAHFVFLAVFPATTADKYLHDYSLLLVISALSNLFSMAHILSNWNLSFQFIIFV